MHDRFPCRLLSRPRSFLADAPAKKLGNPRVAGDSAAARTYSQRVAKLKPTAMKAMPTSRLYCPRSLKNGTLEMSLLKT